ncbi:hypothetical protein GY45DRAFT_1264118, partial [Cubamyces sp. BRFM 1775]
VNLLVTDYFKRLREAAHHMDCAEELIKWFNNHSRALAMLKDEQRRRDPEGHVLALLYPAATRWSSRYLTCTRLLELEASIRCLLITKLDELVQFTPRGKNAEETARKQEKTREMLKYAMQQPFWDNIRVYVPYSCEQI